MVKAQQDPGPVTSRLRHLLEPLESMQWQIYMTLHVHFLPAFGLAPLSLFFLRTNSERRSVVPTAITELRIEDTVQKVVYVLCDQYSCYGKQRATECDCKPIQG